MRWTFAQHVQPPAIEHGEGKQMIAGALAADELPAQLDHFGQVEVVPIDPAVVHTLEARVEPTADVHDYGIGMSATGSHV